MLTWVYWIGFIITFGFFVWLWWTNRTEIKDIEGYLIMTIVFTFFWITLWVLVFLSYLYGKFVMVKGK